MSKKTANYETVMILNTKIGDDSIKAMCDKFQNLVKEHGTINNIEDWGKRRLAYPIMDETEGYYQLIDFTSSPDFPAELDRVYKITDGVLRSLIIAKEV